ncbi:MAG: 4Fe-4S binding protein [Planctomycetota bacterium]|jgi:hypothetical protein
MIPDAAKGFLLGLSTGVLCLTHCAAVLLPTLAVTRKTTLKTSLLRLGEFSLGRALAYLGVGFGLGWAGALVAPEPMRRLLALLYIPLGALLLLHVLRESDSGSWFCRVLESRRAFVRTPFLLGALSGVAPCAPFGLAMVAVLEGSEGATFSRAFRGLLFFGAFFLGTSLFLLPLVSAGVASRFAPVRRAARLLATLAALFFLFYGLARFLPSPEPAVPGVEEGELRYVFREADAFSSVVEDGAFPYWWALRKEKVRDRRGREVETTSKLGVCFVTTDAAPAIRGWAGEIPVLVGLSSDGTIQGIKVLPGANRETPGFIDPLYEEAFDGKYRGKTVASPFEAGTDVDGVTGVTQSVTAVNEGVRTASRRAAAELLGLDPTAPHVSRSVLPTKPGVYLLAGLALLAVIGYLTRAGAPYRMIVLVLSIVVLGVWLGFYPTTADLTKAFTLDPPSGSAGVAWTVMMIVPLLLALLWGKLHCGWLCPFGAATELLFRLTPGRLALSERWDGRLRRLRFVLLLILPATAIIAADTGVLRFEPLSALFHPRSLSVVAGVLLGWVVVGSILVERFYCKFLCPVGGLMDLLSADRLLGRKPGIVCGRCVRAEKGCRFLREEGEDFKTRRERLRGDCVC